MGKKKKKTIASTRPQVKEVKTQTKAVKKKRLLGKLFAKKKTKAETKGVEESLLKEELQKIEETAKPTEEKIEAVLSAKETEVESHSKKKTKRRLSPEHRQKIRGGLLILIGLFALSFIGWFLFGKVFRAQNLAEILPAEDSVMLVEVNVDGQSGQVKQFYDLMKSYPVYQKEGLLSLMNLVLPVDFGKEIEPWLGRKIGFGLLASSKKGEFERVFFVESRNHDLTLEFMKSQALRTAKEELTTEDYNGKKIYGYTLSNLFAFTFMDNYLVVAENAETLKSVIDKSSVSNLNDSEVYRRVANNLPQGSLVFAYANFGKLFDVLSANESFVAKKGQDFMSLRPYLSLFEAGGLTVFADKGKFVVQTYTGLNKNEIAEKGFITYPEKYQGDLLAIAPQEPIMLLAGHDLNSEIQSLEGLFISSTKSNTVLFDGLLEAQKDIYFGKGISLKNDIYPLFTGEYLFAVEGSYDKPEFTLILDLPNGNKDVPKLEKLVSAFVETSGLFTPHVKDVVLPDGTKGQEIIASPEQVERYEEKYNEYTINNIRLGETGWSIYYLVSDGKAVFATRKDKLAQIIDRIDGKQPASLVTTDYYGKIVQPILRTADEITIVNIGAITEKLGLNDNKALGPYLLPFSNLTAAKNYFTDGISTIYMLEII
jgi:hypothetical protein